jgi:formylglycine-generating enzyme required for sulfatase activity
MLPATGSATSLSNVQLRWNYGVCLETGTGTDYVDAGDQVEVRVFAIEMVYVPGGVDFAVGNTGSESNKFTLTTINTASATTAPSGGGSKGGSAGGYPSGQTAPSSASWPNGYNAFYCMKYEISQGQYRDFLNTLTYNQQATRTGSSAYPPNSPVGSPANYMSVRCGTQIMTSGVSNTVPAVYGSDYNGNKSWNEINDGEWIAQGALSWADGAAYADWAGLRPMTEMEYEKACRGTENAVANEYAWGDASISQADTIITHPGANDEIASSGANAVHGNDTNGPTGGPLRVGVFAKSNTTRAQSGASYWGIMELSGNLFERCVTIGNVAGRSFMGVTGNGMLTAAGDADVDYWPGINGNSTVGTANDTYNGGFGVTQAAGSGYRGGNWKLRSPYLRVSDRATAADASNVRLNTYGFRGVR